MEEAKKGVVIVRQMGSFPFPLSPFPFPLSPVRFSFYLFTHLPHRRAESARTLLLLSLGFYRLNVPLLLPFAYSSRILILASKPLAVLFLLSAS